MFFNSVCLPIVNISVSLSFNIINSFVLFEGLNGSYYTWYQRYYTSCSCWSRGGTQCDYYVMNFMIEIAYERVEILVNNDNVGERVEEYLAIDMDDIHEEWSSYAATFIFN
ncbi:hypothetical protein Hanom_Chr10g00895841 [Helianthus anomalus]